MEEMMGRGSAVRENLTTVRELLTFIWQGRTWWLTPVILVLLLTGIVVVFVESSAVAPFIYVLF
jgi:hypothetical protein